MEEDGVKTLKHSKRILFQRMAPYPQRKVITFNRYTDDFAFDINYGDLSFLSQEDIRLVDFAFIILYVYLYQKNTCLVRMSLILNPVCFSTRLLSAVCSVPST